MVTNAADVPTGQKEKLQKNDSVDSRKLARSLRSGDLEAIYVPSNDTLEEFSSNIWLPLLIWTFQSIVEKNGAK